MSSSTGAPFSQREELLDFLLEVSNLAAETLDLDHLLKSVVQLVRGALPGELAAILLYSERRKVLRIRHAIGHREEIVRSLEVRLGEGVVGTAAMTRKPVRVDDVRADPRYLAAVDPVRSELAVPMMARGRLVGVIDLESTNLNAYSAADQALLTLIANRMGTAIDNARLLRRLERHNRTLRTLASLTQEFNSILDLDQLLERIAVAVRVLINYDSFSILTLEGSTLKHRFSQRYDQRVEVHSIPLGTGVTGHAALFREPVLVRDVQTDPRYIATHEDIRSELAVPLITKDRVVGVMDVESDRMNFFHEDDLRTLTLLSAPIANAIENARLYAEIEARKQEIEQDLAAARRLQRVLLPKDAPPIPGLEIAIGARPAREVSGDIYDFFEHSNDYSLIAFGDSSGKGAAAALYGALVSGLLRSMGPRRRGPAVLLGALNEVLLERRVSAHYVTLLSLLWNSSSRTMTMANAGATPPLIVRGGDILRPTVEGVPIGLLDQRDYEEVSVVLEAGDLLILFSDGLPDQTNAAGEVYGDQQLEAALQRLADDAGTAAAIRDAMFAALDQFRGAVPIADDQTLIVMRVN
jgi:sigma-B regulation protein RsbU (phosphoserine phosphatase)